MEMIKPVRTEAEYLAPAKEEDKKLHWWETTNSFAQRFGNMTIDSPIYQLQWR